MCEAFHNFTYNLIYETNEDPVLLSFLRAKTMSYQQYFENNIHTFQSEKSVISTWCI